MPNPCISSFFPKCRRPGATTSSPRNGAKCARCAASSRALWRSSARSRSEMLGSLGPRVRGDDGWEQRMYHVYMLASRRHGTLYIGVTNDLRARLELHGLGLGSEFVKKYAVHKLVYVEPYENAEDAI